MTKRAIALALFLTTISANRSDCHPKRCFNHRRQPVPHGMNIGDVCWYSNCTMLKNIVGNNNPNFEPMEDRRIWVVDSTEPRPASRGQSTMTIIPPNYFVGAQYNVISVQAGGARAWLAPVWSLQTPMPNWPGGGAATNPTFTLGNGLRSSPGSRGHYYRAVLACSALLDPEPYSEQRLG